MVTYTSTYNLKLPVVGQDDDAWGGYINDNTNALENLLTGNTTITSLVITTADINGGTLDNVVIGGTTAAAVTGTTITGTSFVSSGDMTFGDNDKAIFGAGSDLQIYHDGSNSYISDQGTGNLRVLATNFNVKDATGTRDLFYAQDGGLTKIYYNGLDRIETTSTGIDVTGTVTADGLTVNSGTGNEGISVVSTDAGSYISVADNGTTGSTRFGAVSNDFKIDVNSTERLRIDSSGQVGIGTSSPSRNLYISGGSSSRADVQLSYDALGTTANDGVQFGIQSGGGYIWNFENSALYFATNNTERMRIASSGATTFESSITAKSTSVISYAGYAGFEYHNTSGQWEGYVGTENNTGNLRYNSRQGVHKFYSNGTQRVVIESDGNTIIQHNDNNYDDGLTLRSTLDWGYGASLSFDAVTSSGGSNGTVGKIQSRWQSAGNHALDFYVFGSSSLTQKARLDATGLAINTTTVTYPLTVKGTVGFQATNSSNAWAAYTYTDNTFRINYNGSGGDEITIDTSGNMTLSYGNLIVPSAIQHLGDTDTQIIFGNNQIYLNAGGVNTYILSTSYASTYVPNYNYAAYFEETASLSGTTPTINAATSGVFYLTMSGNTTFTFTNTSSNWGVGFILYLTGNGSTVTWPASVDWAGGSAPDAPGNGEVDILVFHTRDGSNWVGALAVDAAA